MIRVVVTTPACLPESTAHFKIEGTLFWRMSSQLVSCELTCALTPSVSKLAFTPVKKAEAVPAESGTWWSTLKVYRVKYCTGLLLKRNVTHFDEGRIWEGLEKEAALFSWISISLSFENASSCIRNEYHFQTLRRKFSSYSPVRVVIPMPSPMKRITFLAILVFGFKLMALFRSLIPLSYQCLLYFSAATSEF